MTFTWDTSQFWGKRLKTIENRDEGLRVLFLNYPAHILHISSSTFIIVPRSVNPLWQIGDATVYKTLCMNTSEASDLLASFLQDHAHSDISVRISLALFNIVRTPTYLQQID